MPDSFTLSQSKNEDRINEILNELSDCREDERSSQSQTVQVVATAGTVLGVLFGASVFTYGQTSVGQSRSLFVLSIFIFCTAFGFISTIGISNVLRYHYIQSLEDKLSALISPPGQDAMIHWMSLSSPILTRNPAHLKSAYSKMHYLFYSASTLCASAFCVYVVVFLYSQIQSYEILDYALFAAFIFVMGGSLFTFLLVSVKAQQIYAFSLNASLQKRKARLSLHKDPASAGPSSPSNPTPPSSRKKGLLRLLKYFIYPKLKDIQKPALILIGYLFGIFLSNGMTLPPLTAEQVKQLIITLVVIDGLIYQARYQWNDIRGLSEDVKAKKSDRLPVEILGTRNAVRLSSCVIAAKLILAGVISCRMLDTIGRVLMIGGASIIVTAILYEIARAKKAVKCIYVLVSLGYPLRLLIGIFAAWPAILSGRLTIGVAVLPKYTLFGLLLILFLAYAFLGAFSACLPWVHEAIDQRMHLNDFTKTHYADLFKKVEERYDSLTPAELRRGWSPLYERGKISDPWNCQFVISSLLFFSLCTMFFSLEWNPALIFIEILLCGGAFVSCVLGKNWSILSTAFMAVLIALKVIVSLFSISWYPLYVVISCNQLLLILLYFFLRYRFQPDYSFIENFKNMAACIAQIIIGRDTANLIKSESKKR